MAEGHPYRRIPVEQPEPGRHEERAQAFRTDYRTSPNKPMPITDIEHAAIEWLNVGV